MILEFSIKNTLSIKDEQLISFEAAQSSDDLNCVEMGGKKFLKLACIYGANASGKTKLEEALYFYIHFLKGSFLGLEPTQEIPFTPFLFDQMTKDQPGEFRLVFYADDFESDNAVRYEYYLKLNRQQVLEESLYYSPKGQKKLVFERNGQDIKWGSCVTGAKKTVVELTRANCSVISAGAQAKNKVFLHIYEHFNTRFKGLYDNYSSPSVSRVARKIEEDADFKEKVLKLLSYSDFGNISDITVEKEELPQDFIKQFVPEVQNQFSKINSRKVSLVHRYGNDYPLPIMEESAGTCRIMELALPLYRITQSPSFCMIDEIESSLHLQIIETFLQLFLESSDESQLLFTTHNQDLLESGLLRDDEIWFCNRRSDGGSEYSSITDYTGIRKGVSRKKLYQADKFGALPYVDMNALREVFNAKKNQDEKSE